MNQELKEKLPSYKSEFFRNCSLLDIDFDLPQNSDIEHFKEELACLKEEYKDFDFLIFVNGKSKSNSTLQSQINPKFSNVFLDMAQKGENYSFLINKNTVVVNCLENQNSNYQAINLKNNFLLENNSNAEIYFTTINKLGKSFVNVINKFKIGDNCNVSINYLQNNANSITINQTFVDINCNSIVKTSAVSIDGLFVQNLLQVDFLKPDSQLISSGITLVENQNSYNNTCFVNHHTINCTCNQDYKTIAKDYSTSEFYGLVTVKEGAIKTQASQLNKNILLSKNAKILSNPQLEIYADDVKCTHGTTTGMLNQDQIFYMQTRGINKQTAQNMLIKTLIEENLQMIDNPSYQEKVRNLCYQKLS